MHQSAVEFSRGMTREEFIRINSDRMFDCELQSFRVGSEIWRDLVKHGLPPALILEVTQGFLGILSSSASERAKREEIERIVGEADYHQSHAEMFGKMWTRWPAQGSRRSWSD